MFPTVVDARIAYPTAPMRANEGYEIWHNGVPRTFRDRKEIADEAARLPRPIIYAVFRALTIDIRPAPAQS